MAVCKNCCRKLHYGSYIHFCTIIDQVLKIQAFNVDMMPLSLSLTMNLLNYQIVA